MLILIPSHKVPAEASDSRPGERDLRFHTVGVGEGRVLPAHAGLTALQPTVILWQYVLCFLQKRLGVPSWLSLISLLPGAEVTVGSLLWAARRRTKPHASPAGVTDS